MAESPYNAALPFKLDYEVSGPAAGMFANEALGNWRDQRDLANQNNQIEIAKNQLDLETKQKDVPLKDAERENKLRAEAVTADLYSKGILQERQVQEAKAAISKATTQMSDDTRKQMENKALPWAEAASALAGDYSPAKAGMYEHVKRNMADQGITLPDTYDLNAHQMIQAKGQMSGIYLTHKLAMDKENAHNKTLIDVANIQAGSREKAAATAAGAKSPPDDNKAQMAQARQAAFSPQGADPNDILRAYQAHVQSQKDKVDQDVEKRVPDVASALTRMKAREPQNYAAQAAKVNMTADADPVMLARSLVYQETMAKEIQSFALSFAGGKVRSENGLVPITPAVVGQIVGQRISQASKPMPGQVPVNRGGNPPPVYGSGAPPVSQAPTPSVAYGSEDAVPAASVTEEGSSAVAPVQTTQKRQVELAPDGSPMTPGQFPGQVATMSNGDTFVWKDKKWVRTQGPAKK